MPLTVISAAFADGDEIPRRYTCDGENVSPPLDVSNVPPGTAELVLLLEDPDAPAGTFVHWVLWGLDPRRPTLGEAVVPAGTAQGSNSFGRQEYGGPCPPPGAPHRYVFTVYALSEPLRVAAGGSAEMIRSAMAGKVLASGGLIGRYGR